ncbi:hypothetical protein F4806DRAFT_483926 [Annulohypoxylon nitens]|nr:hypothetical protein F4806DRAFT_483926 [Annulohypoxylon nitens]
MSPDHENNLLLKWAIIDDPAVQAQVNDCIKRTKWEAICECASRANHGQPCKVLPDFTNGGSSLARLLEFQDGTRWIARVPSGKYGHG